MVFVVIVKGIVIAVGRCCERRGEAKNLHLTNLKIRWICCLIPISYLRQPENIFKL
jgi:hypothetical protein